MPPEINPQTVEDIGKYNNIVWAIAGFLLSGFGILIKKIGSFVFNKWVCFVKKVDRIEKELEHLKAKHEKDLELKDAEIEHMKEIIIEIKIEARETDKRIDLLMRG